MVRQKTTILLFAIICLSFFLRFYKLSSFPPGLSSDEVSFAYNAYTLSREGVDQFGVKFPFYFEAFGEYKNPVPVYILIPFLAFFGNNAFAIRIPIVVLSSLSTILFYLLIKKIFQKRRIALLASFFWAISSWNIFFSRFSNGYLLGMIFLLSGILFFLNSKKSVFLAFLGAVFFLLSFYSYHSPKLVILALLPVLFWFFPIKRKTLLIFCIFFLLGLIPTIFHWRETLKRSEMVKLTNNLHITEKLNNYIHDFKPGEMPIWLVRAVVNKPIIYSRVLLDQFFYHFSPHFLVIESDQDPLFHFPDEGVIYLWQFPLLIVGSFWILKERKINFFIFYFWFISILPSALSASLWSISSRSFLSTIPITVITAYGGNAIWERYFIKSRWKVLLSLGISGVVTYSLVAMIINYFFHFKREAIIPWRYGDSLAVSYLRKNTDRYEKIVVDDNLLLAEHFLFYSELSPKDFQTWEINRKINEYGFTHIEQIDKLLFLDKIKSRNRLRNTQGKVLWVGFSGNKPEAPCGKMENISNALGFGQEIIALKNNEMEDFTCEN